jgi:hypothetical protein
MYAETAHRSRCTQTQQLHELDKAFLFSITLLDLDEFARFPGLIEKGDFCAVKANNHHEVATLDRLNPVGLRCITRFARTKKRVARFLSNRDSSSNR